MTRHNNMIFVPDVCILSEICNIEYYVIYKTVLLGIVLSRQLDLLH